MEIRSKSRTKLKKAVIGICFTLVAAIILSTIYLPKLTGFEKTEPASCQNLVESQVAAKDASTPDRTRYVQMPRSCVANESIEWADGADSNDMAGYFPNASEGNRFRLKKRK